MISLQESSVAKLGFELATPGITVRHTTELQSLPCLNAVHRVSPLPET